MSSMPDAEVFGAVVWSVIGLGVWGRWYRQTLSVSKLNSNHFVRLPILLVPPLCALLLLYLLRKFASHDVRNDEGYLWFYTAMGAAWVGTATLLLPLFGLSARDDPTERGNVAAAAGISGALIS